MRLRIVYEVAPHVFRFLSSYRLLGDTNLNILYDLQSEVALLTILVNLVKYFRESLSAALFELLTSLSLYASRQHGSYTLSKFSLRATMA